MFPTVLIIRLLLEIFGQGVTGDSAELITCPEELPLPGGEQPVIVIRTIDPWASPGRCGLGALVPSVMCREGRR